jgi:uncharacterized protein (TIGR04255 family)
LEAASAQLSDLVTFGRPPVNEVYLAVQFGGEVSDEVFALGDFWPRIREEFPHFERQPALPRVEEKFEVPPVSSGTVFPFQFGTGAPPQRYWFVSADSTRLIQVQPDRFLFNWRRVRPDDAYPRFRTLLPEFERLFNTLRESLPEDRRAAATADWCEVGYINHVEAPADHDARAHLPLSGILRFVLEPETEALRPIEDMQLQVRSLIGGEDNAPLGRIYLSAVPAYRTTDQMPIYVIEMTVRARPAGPAVADLLEFFRRGREMVVTTFRDVTTDEMHVAWELQEGA